MTSTRADPHGTLLCVSRTRLDPNETNEDHGAS
jgi:hypothetical protein